MEYTGKITANYTFANFITEVCHNTIGFGEFVNKTTKQPFAALVMPSIKTKEGKDSLAFVSEKVGKPTTKQELIDILKKEGKKLQVVKIDSPDYDDSLYSICYQADNVQIVDNAASFLGL